MKNFFNNWKGKTLFNLTPHKHPRGNIPNWDIQPENVKQVFRNKPVKELWTYWIEYRKRKR